MNKKNKKNTANATASNTSTTSSPAADGTTPTVEVKAGAATEQKPLLKKGPSPVFSIPATEADKNFITLQSARTGLSQKALLTMGITAAKEAIEALPKYVAPAPKVATKAAKAEAAEQKLAEPAPTAPVAEAPVTEPVTEPAMA